MEREVKSYNSYKNLSYIDGNLPESVRHDLNIDELCEKIDYTSSCIGRQFLYHLLCIDKVSTVNKHEELIGHLQKHVSLRRRTSEILNKINKPEAYTIVGILSENTYYSRRYLFLLQVCRWLPLIFSIWMLLAATSALPFILFLLSYIGNAFLHYRQKSKLLCYYFSIPQLYKLLLTADKLAQIEEFLKTDSTIGDCLDRLKKLKKMLHSFRLGIALQSESALLLFLITELANIFTLYAAVNVAESFLCIRNKRKEIEHVFEFVGLIDVLCSLSFFRDSLPYWCKPTENRNEEMLYACSICHPLIDNCVPNDLALSEKSIIITGSNMSGKTSFIRTIAVNLLLGKVLNTCFAKEFRIDLSRRIYSVIHTEDDLIRGKSFFLKEVENVKKAIDMSNDGKYLLVFDELFKGTNTIERIAINYALLSDFAKSDHIILASTHDNEITTLLQDKYDLYYFSETVADTQLEFDYKLKKGVDREGNAIKILKLYKYPDSVVSMAERLRLNYKNKALT